MIPMGTQTDQWIADIGSYIRNAFGNSGTFISPSDVARVRAETKDRTTPWTAAGIEAALPVLMQSHTGWKASASHNAASAQGLTLAGWTSSEPQRPGMWFQVELPEAATVTEVQFDAAGGGRLGGGGNRGRGSRGAAPGGAGTAGADAGEAGGGRGAAAPPPVIGYPRQFRVELSLDGNKWQAVAEGSGAPLTTAAFKPVRTKYTRISQTAEAPAAPPWVVQNLRIFRTPDR